MEQLKQTESIETLHNDEAVRVIAHYDGNQSWEPSEEKRLVRKVDWRLLPLMCGTYALQYYDKAMISQAVCHSLERTLPSS